MTMSKRKVLFLAESLNVGGAERALVSILKMLDYDKLDVTLKLISKSGQFISECEDIKRLNVSYIVKPTSNHIISYYNAIKIKAFYQWLPSTLVGNYLYKNFDVVIAFCEGYLTKWLAASNVKSQKIAWVHTDMVNNDWPVNTNVFHSFEEEKTAYHKIDQVVAVSQIVADGMKIRFNCNNTIVINNILNSDISSKANSKVPTLRKAKLNIVSVGRLEYVKGYDMLVDAMNKLVNHLNLDIHLCLVGDGSQRFDIEQRISVHGLNNNITVAGSQANPYPYVKAADIFVCPSRQEGFNIAILEAMTLGKPVIATNCAGPSEILCGGKYGLLIDSTVDSLVRGISQLYNNDEELLKLSELSIDRSKFYSSDTQLESLYRIIGL